MRNGKVVPPSERDALIHEARLPSTLKMAGNFAKAVGKHIGNGLKKVDISEYQRRLNVCNDCELRRRTRCTHEECGCFIDKKAWWDSESCPMNKW